LNIGLTVIIAAALVSTNNRHLFFYGKVLTGLTAGKHIAFP